LHIGIGYWVLVSLETNIIGYWILGALLSIVLTLNHVYTHPLTVRLQSLHYNNNNNNNNNHDDIYSAVNVAELLREFTRFMR